MKLSILTTITNPDERQDKWLEALECYLDLADEVVVVNGGKVLIFNEVLDNQVDYKKLGDFYLYPEGKIKVVNLPWPYEWNWIELPRHLNAGLEKCTGDWIIKLDIDQFFHEKDFDSIRKKLAECPKDCQVATFQKMSLVYGKKYYQKGGQPIAFRNEPEIVIGKNLDRRTDLCFAIKQTGTVKVEDYNLPIGRDLRMYKTGISYWNYDYFFKTKEFTKKEFFRFSRAYYRYFKSWEFGETEEESFRVFLEMMKGRYNRSPYTYKLSDHSKYIRGIVRNLKPKQFGYNAWGLI